MAYSTALRKAIGDLRACLGRHGLERQSARFAEHGEHEPAADAPLVLAACSGGRDSMALAAVARTVCGMLGLRCGAAIVDHGMQPGSAAVAAETADRCRALGLRPVDVRRVHVPLGRGDGAEAAARDARYAALCELAAERGAALVLLAHTRDDQAETVLIGLARSGGLDAIVGMPETTVRMTGTDGGAVEFGTGKFGAVEFGSGTPGTAVRFARPWLDVTRAQTTAICRELGLDWWDDPTNGDAVPAGQSLDGSYPLRSRIRHDLVPAMARCWGADPSARLAAGAASARLDADYLDGRAAELAERALTVVREEERSVARLDAAALAAEHPALRRRVIVRALRALAIPVAATHVEAVDRLVTDWHGQRPLALPSQCSASRKGHVIEVCEDRRHANR
ncbi:tRNA lysidine(34) synthetase TilS [Bifidobacterium avesanii]|uniref:tRNA(Ile)-lysidine synthase n=1 Tax=Bifidobacterium avesanii TaxID=1798157 RepID=A0A7K3TJ53_9BIFI|nr:tRNA lysidine(34) synthetase TilS [Bifidobacterium avesanii]KAB8289595.1 tRNA(Ile)-lysidine synthetase [Bifidobacterium avesanii]NEG79148.1 tRNA lysidine(34) synthetase TilS [Bifidobacterium avesanii]